MSGWVVVVVVVVCLCVWVCGCVCGRLGLVFFELACCPHSVRLFTPENMAKEEVAKLVVGNDSGTCKASFF